MPRNNTIPTPNPFGIPDLTPMYKKVRDYVKLHQGEKGFILTENDENDTIWTFVYDPLQNRAVEYQVKAVRVNAEGELMLIYDNPRIVYDDKAVKEELAKGDAAWNYVQDDEFVYYIHTIFEIADFIREYVVHPSRKKLKRKNHA